jgi:hypothetical protein
VSHTNTVHDLQHCTLKTHFNIIFPSKPRCSEACTSFSFSKQNPQCISLLLYTSNQSLQSYRRTYDHPHHMCCRAHSIIQIPISRFSPAPCHFTQPPVTPHSPLSLQTAPCHFTQSPVTFYSPMSLHTAPVTSHSPLSLHTAPCHFTQLLLAEWMQSTYFPTDALRNTNRTTHIKTPTCFGTHVPSSRSFNNKSARAKLLIFLSIVTSWMKILVVRIHKIYFIDIVNNLQCFYNILIKRRLGSFQYFVSVFWCCILISSQFFCWFTVVYMGSVYRQRALLHMIYPISLINSISKLT